MTEDRDHLWDQLLDQGSPSDTVLLDVCVGLADSVYQIGI